MGHKLIHPVPWIDYSVAPCQQVSTQITALTLARERGYARFLRSSAASDAAESNFDHGSGFLSNLGHHKSYRNQSKRRQTNSLVQVQYTRMFQKLDQIRLSPTGSLVEPRSVG